MLKVKKPVYAGKRASTMAGRLLMPTYQKELEAYENTKAGRIKHKNRQ